MNLAVQIEENRAQPRSRVLLAAFLSYGGHAFTPQCVIRNLTSGGAAVRLESPLRLPDEVALVEQTSGRAHRARVVWQRNGFVGLEIVATQDLRSAGSNSALRQLWIDRLPRQA